MFCIESFPTPDGAGPQLTGESVVSFSGVICSHVMKEATVLPEDGTTGCEVLPVDLTLNRVDKSPRDQEGQTYRWSMELTFDLNQKVLDRRVMDAMLLGMHPRLGRDSPIYMLSGYALRDIFQILTRCSYGGTNRRVAYIGIDESLLLLRKMIRTPPFTPNTRYSPTFVSVEIPMYTYGGSMGTRLDPSAVVAAVNVCCDSEISSSNLFIFSNDLEHGLSLSKDDQQRLLKCVPHGYYGYVCPVGFYSNAYSWGLRDRNHRTILPNTSGFRHTFQELLSGTEFGAAMRSKEFTSLVKMPRSVIVPDSPELAIAILFNTDAITRRPLCDQWGMLGFVDCIVRCTLEALKRIEGAQPLSKRKHYLTLTDVDHDIMALMKGYRGFLIAGIGPQSASVLLKGVELHGSMAVPGDSGWVDPTYQSGILTHIEFAKGGKLVCPTLTIALMRMVSMSMHNIGSGDWCHHHYANMEARMRSCPTFGSLLTASLLSETLTLTRQTIQAPDQ